MQYDYDLITIGAGSGGVAACRRAAAHGARVLLVEADRVGGTCVMRGCVPKKIMMYAASFADMVAQAPGYGWSLGAARFDMAHWADKKAAELDRLERVYHNMLAQSGVTLLHGYGRIQAAHTVAVDGRTYTAGRILLATGGTPNRPDVEGLDVAMTSDDLLNLRSVPDSLLIIGGGYIGVEFASIMARLGAKVHMVYRDTWPLRGFDHDLRTRLATALQAKGVVLHSNQQIERLEATANGHVLHVKDGATIAAQAALNATGRRPNVAGLGLQAVGIQIDKKGAIPVDNFSHTTADHVWAIGDVTNRVNLTPMAIAQGRAFADTEFGKQRREADHEQFASAVFTDPPIGTVGLTEQAASQCAKVDVYESEFRPMKDAFVGGQTRTYMKLLADAQTGKVLGVHMIGADAPEIIQSLSVAVRCGATKADFDRTLAVHPTSAEEFVLMREKTRTAGPATGKKADSQA